jgi:hypothetical protein
MNLNRAVVKYSGAFGIFFSCFFVAAVPAHMHCGGINVSSNLIVKMVNTFVLWLHIYLISVL